MTRTRARNSRMSVEIPRLVGGPLREPHPTLARFPDMLRGRVFGTHDRMWTDDPGQLEKRTAAPSLIVAVKSNGSSNLPARIRRWAKAGVPGSILLARYPANRRRAAPTIGRLGKVAQFSDRA